MMKNEKVQKIYSDHILRRPQLIFSPADVFSLTPSLSYPLPGFFFTGVYLLPVAPCSRQPPVSTRKDAKTSEPAPETGSEEDGVLLQPRLKRKLKPNSKVSGPEWVR